MLFSDNFDCKSNYNTLEHKVNEHSISLKLPKLQTCIVRFQCHCLAVATDYPEFSFLTRVDSIITQALNRSVFTIICSTATNLEIT